MTEQSTIDSENKTETFQQAQADMRRGYGNGAIGVFVSGLMWLAASFTAYQFSDKRAIWTLFVGGMLIFPVSLLLGKLMGLTGTHTKGNLLGSLAMEGTIAMLMSLPLALGLSFLQTEWFFQAMLLIIGGRYLTFSTIYGYKIYWILGGLLGVSAWLLFSLKVQSFGSALTGALIEITFGLFMYFSFRKAN